MARSVITREEARRCPECGSVHTVRHGYNVTKKGRFPRRKCQQCGTTFYEKEAAV